MTKTEAPFENRFTYRLKGVSCFFCAVKNGNQTGIVDSILFLKSIGDSYTALLPELNYDYDANGNIIRVYENDIQRVR